MTRRVHIGRVIALSIIFGVTAGVITALLHVHGAAAGAIVGVVMGAGVGTRAFSDAPKRNCN